MQGNNDTLKVALMIDEESVLADTGRVPLRYLIDGNKRSTASLNLTKDGILYGTLSLEI